MPLDKAGVPGVWVCLEITAYCDGLGLERDFAVTNPVFCFCEVRFPFLFTDIPAGGWHGFPGLSVPQHYGGDDGIGQKTDNFI
jgi:hypothetical protein